MAGVGWTSQLSRRQRGIIGILVVGLAVAGLWPGGSNRPTEEYWKSVYELAVEANDLRDAPEDAIQVLQDFERRLVGLPTEGVDQLAVDASIRFREALIAGRRCAEHARWMEDHPIRVVVGTLVGQAAIKKLKPRLSDLRDKLILAYGFALDAQGQLSERYPRSTFATPIPPDVQPIDEKILVCDAGLVSVVDLAKEIGGLVLAAFL